REPGANQTAPERIDDFEAFWRAALRRGVALVPVAETAQPALQPPGAVLTFDPPPLDGDGLEFTLVVHPTRMGDGSRTGNRPWLLELPDPISKITWHSWVELHPDAAGRLGVRNGDIVQVSSPHGEVQAPVWI